MVLALGPAVHADPVVNVYSARKEALIKPLLDKFRAETGIEARLVTAEAGPLLERLRREGRNSPADLFITVDAGRLHQAKTAGLLQPVESAALEASVPAAYRDPQGLWFGLSLRARPIMYATDRVHPDQLDSYLSLADPRWRGRICIRSSSNIYNQSLVASVIAAHGEAETLEWLKGLVKNFARKPAGGDRDQIRAAAAGECDIAIANTYYLARMRGAEPGSADREAAEALAVFWPNQNGRGVHVNVSGAGVTNAAPNRDNAIRLLEFLVTDEAQAWYARVNNEYPVKPGVPWSDAVREMGRFKADDLNLAVLGSNNALAVKLMDQAGWQ
ncbi:MAG TPA: Fe(3+) ABC transporter substrate-binding protein [Gammaproteobacteria bacterium]|nr:Fe(3+) ABC transporter substrate-binding protein [Gammaproteobacteria bacterium]